MMLRAQGDHMELPDAPPKSNGAGLLASDDEAELFTLGGDVDKRGRPPVGGSPS